MNSVWAETSENLGGADSASSSSIRGAPLTSGGVSAKRANPSPPPGSRVNSPLSRICSWPLSPCAEGVRGEGRCAIPAAQTAQLQYSSLPTGGPWPAPPVPLGLGGAEAVQCSGLCAGTEGLPVTRRLLVTSLCGTVPREHLSAPVDPHVPRKGSKAEPGRRWLFPGSCGSPWERQGRPVRFRAVITALGTEKDYPPCAPFREFSGLPLVKQMQNAAICSPCP